MTPIAGGVALNLALGFSILAVIALFLYTRNGDQRLFLTGQRLALGISFFCFSRNVHSCISINPKQF